MMLTVFAFAGIPEVTADHDLVQLVGDLVEGTLQDGDILAITSKIVSKAEGRSVRADDREDAITAETVRIVASREHARGTTRIVENHLGMVLAAAGVDSSNTPSGTVLLLPVDPDASALRIATALRERFNLRIGVIITDTLGRPWRQGQTDVAIGAAGVHVLDDLRGSTDAGGKLLEVTMAASADEIAAAADLIKGKASGLPVAVVRGLRHLVGALDLPGAAALVRPAAEDMFRVGSQEAYDEGYAAGLAASQAINQSREPLGRER